MHRRLIATIVVLLMAMVVALAAVSLASSRNFASPMSGDQEVPAEGAPDVETNATGLAKYQLSADGTEMSFRLNVGNIENVTQAHIHLGARGENGDIVVWLYPDGPPPELIPGRTNGTLATFTFTADDLVG
ncbi:MAG: CHRD domain-containing protein, partial [Nitriliruptorales bacterium]|nr:CHRD domain-containing protein [Nitriliruptorales bacterium]